jgi:hypothetical protein
MRNHIFKVTYQDKTLNRTSIEIEAACWEEAIPVAYENKRADQKIIYIEFIK